MLVANVARVVGSKRILQDTIASKSTITFTPAATNRTAAPARNAEEDRREDISKRRCRSL